MKDAMNILLERLGIDVYLAALSPDCALAAAQTLNLTTNSLHALRLFAASSCMCAGVTIAMWRSAAALYRDGNFSLMRVLVQGSLSTSSLTTFASSELGATCARILGEREVLCARELHLGVDGTTLYFQCPECPVRLAVKGAPRSTTLKGTWESIRTKKAASTTVSMLRSKVQGCTS